MAAPVEGAKAAEAPESLDALVRRVDPERWLASRFIADPQRRAVVVALYALNYELARVGETVTQALTGEIRLAWWREQLEAAVAGAKTSPHPVLLALGPDLKSGRLPSALLDALVEARHADFEPAPFEDDAALARYMDGTAGAMMGLAARALSPEAPLRAVVEAGRAWSLAGLYLARERWAERDRSWVPASWGTLAEAALGERVQAEVASALMAARREIKVLDVAAFPAVAYVGLAALYARGRAPGELEMRGRLLATTLTGRV
ncbi:MAG: phytoene/squalene synthase family protein [Caulobacteraceae bacterium]